MGGERCPCLWRVGQLTLLSGSPDEEGLLLSVARPGPPMPPAPAPAHTSAPPAVWLRPPLSGPAWARLPAQPATWSVLSLRACLCVWPWWSCTPGLSLHFGGFCGSYLKMAPSIWAPGKARPGPTSSLPTPRRRAILNTNPRLPQRLRGPACHTLGRGLFLLHSLPSCRLLQPHRRPLPLSWPQLTSLPPSCGS